MGVLTNGDYDNYEQNVEKYCNDDEYDEDGNQLTVKHDYTKVY